MSTLDSSRAYNIISLSFLSLGLFFSFLKLPLFCHLETHDEWVLSISRHPPPQSRRDLMLEYLGDFDENQLTVNLSCKLSTNYLFPFDNNKVERLFIKMRKKSHEASILPPCACHYYCYCYPSFVLSLTHSLFPGPGWLTDTFLEKRKKKKKAVYA